jgi:anthranilate phosphoribosyltransferase
LEVHDGAVTDTTLDPKDLGFEIAELDDLRGGDAATSAAIARAVVGGETGPRRDVVLLNAGAALTVADVAASLAEGIEAAAASIDEGRASATLERWIVASTAAATG